jgi:hypothetical protein
LAFHNGKYNGVYRLRALTSLDQLIAAATAGLIPPSNEPRKDELLLWWDDSFVPDTARFHRKWRNKSLCGIKGVITHKSFPSGEFAPFSRLNERRLIYRIFERVVASYQNITAARKRQAMRYHIVKSITTVLGAR